MKNRKLKFIYYFIFLALVSFTVVSCKDDPDEVTQGNWEKMSDFDGLPRSDAAGFVIGGNGYFGTGYEGKVPLADFWEYSVSGNYWTRKADFPGAARYGAVGFSIENKGYIGTGYDRFNYYKDFYEYDAQANEWQEIADFPGTARWGAVAFAVGGKGYVGTGVDNVAGNMKDFYAYSPSTRTWDTNIISIKGSKRRGASSFVINGKAYVVSGTDNSTNLRDLWEFNPAAGTNGDWIQKRDIANTSDESYDDEYSGIERASAVAFSIGGKGYLTAGSSASGNSTTSWEYDPVSDLWVKRTGFTGYKKGSSRIEAVGFAIGNYGYVVGGRSGSYYLDDIWRFDPTKENDE